MRKRNSRRFHWEGLDMLDDYRMTYQGEPFTDIAYENYDNGQLESEASFVNGILNGLRLRYYRSGVIESREHLRHGGLDGLCQYWYPNRQMSEEKLYGCGVLKKQRLWDVDGKLLKDDWA